MSRALPAVLDVVLVVLFAAVGRRSHAEGLDVGGILRTAAPFLVGTAAGWLLASITLDSGPRTLAFGAVVVVCTVVLGMLLPPGGRRGHRALVRARGDVPVLVAVLLLGWRLVAPHLVD